MKQHANVALGTSTFGREIDREAAFGVLDHAWSKGIRHLDTAALYSAGRAEEILGEWLRDRQPADGLTVATKLYPPYTATAIAAACARSLRSLGRDRIDVFYFHKWDPTAATEEAARAMDQLVRSGQAGAVGASNFAAAQLAEVCAIQDRHGLAPVRFLQNLNNFAVREFDEPLHAQCAARDIKVLTYSPVGAGFLSGKHRHGVAPGSRFAVSPGHQDIYAGPEAAARLDTLTQVAAASGISQVTLALAWAFLQPGVDWVLIGARHSGHIDQALAARALELSERSGLSGLNP